jgi:hypothetical protein
MAGGMIAGGAVVLYRKNVLPDDDFPEGIRAAVVGKVVYSQQWQS